MFTRNTAGEFCIRCCTRRTHKPFSPAQLASYKYLEPLLLPENETQTLREQAILSSYHFVLPIMKSVQLNSAAALMAFLHLSSAQSSIVTGTPIGFASGVTGGGDAAAVYPTTIDELITYLTDPSPQNIVIEGTFDFVGSEGTATYPACDAYSCTPDNGGQALLNTLEGCGSSTLYDVTLDAAGMEGINVASDKTLVGLGTDTVLNGKGLRFVGVSNIIVQNIAITNLNPQYVWGGDAIVFSDTSTIWVDHVTTSSLGRQHYSFGQESDEAITISNSYIDGQTDYSATCDGHTYWTLELVGSGDRITFYRKLRARNETTQLLISI